MKSRSIQLVVLLILSVMGVGTLLIPSIPEVIHFLLACAIVGQAVVASLIFSSISKK